MQKKLLITGFVLFALFAASLPFVAYAATFWADYFEDGNLNEYTSPDGTNIGVVIEDTVVYAGNYSVKADNDLGEDAWGSSVLRRFVGYSNAMGASIRWRMEADFEGRLGPAVFQCRWRKSLQGYYVHQFPLEVVVRYINNVPKAFLYVKDFSGDLTYVAGPITLTEETWYQAIVKSSGGGYEYIHFGGTTYYPTVQGHATAESCNWNGQKTEIVFGVDALDDVEYSGPQYEYFDNFLGAD